MRSSMLVALPIVLALGLGACSNKTENAAEKAADSAGNDIERAADKAGDAIEEGADKVGSVVKNAGDKAEDTRAKTEADMQDESVSKAKKD